MSYVVLSSGKKHWVSKEGELAFVKRVGRGKYLRRRVKTAAKIERGEKLQAMWQQEWEEAEYAPTRWAHIQWKSDDRVVDRQVKVRLSGPFFSEEDIQKKAEKKLHQWTGKILKASEAPGGSPGLVLVGFNKEKMKNVKYYDPKRTTRIGRYGLGYEVKQ